VSLLQVQRQTDIDYREAIQTLRRNPALGFQKLDEIGAVREVPFAERAQAVERAYRETPVGRSVLVVAPTHQEIATITAAIREARKAAGELGSPAAFQRHVPRNYTTAQKADPRNFEPGLVIEFHRSVKGIEKYEALEVTGIESVRILARNAKGAEISILPRHARAFEVYERHDIEIAPGDRLLLTANRHQQNFRATNGELVTVVGFDHLSRIHLEDGRILPHNYRQFTHGYAVTAHRSQGKTVDAVVVSADSMSRELFYVAASRGRESVTIVTSDKEQLAQSVGRSGQRQSALELQRLMEAAQADQSISQYRNIPEQMKGQQQHYGITQ